MRASGEVHPDSETIMSTLIELSVRGMSWKIPLPADHPIITSVNDKLKGNRNRRKHRVVRCVVCLPP